MQMYFFMHAARMQNDTRLDRSSNGKLPYKLKEIGIGIPINAFKIVRSK